MEDFSIHWNSRLSNASATLEVGQVVVRSGDGTYLPATAANRAATGRKSAGLARSNADTRNRSFAGQFCGIVPAGLSGLGEGPQDDYVRVDDEGFLERVTTPDFDADDVVGRCDADGTAYVVFGNAVVKDTIVAADIARSAGSAIDRVEGFNGTALETTDTPGVGEVWTYRAVDGKYRSAKPSPWVNVKDYGAVGDGVTDDTVAILAAVEAVKTACLVLGTGVRMHFPAGVYLCSEQLDFDTTDADHKYQSVTLYGDGGGLTGQWRAASSLIYTGDDAWSFISARSSSGFTIESMAVLYNNGGFEGTLVDVSKSGAGYDTNNPTFRDVLFASDHVAHTSAANLLYLDGANCGVIENCNFWGAVAGIRHFRGDGYAGQVEYNSGFSNRHTIYGCSFGYCSLAGIVNPPTQSGIVSNCTFEGNAMPAALTCDFSEDDISIFGFRFEGNWIGDCDPAFDSTPCIDNNGHMSWSGASFDANFFGANAAKDSIILGSSFGVSITGNTIGTIDFTLVGISYPQGISITGNYLLGTNSEANPFFRGLEYFSAGVLQSMLQINRVHIAGNNAPSLGSLDHLNFAGHIVATPILFTAPQIAGVTNVAPTLEGNFAAGSNDTAGRITLVSTGGGGAAGVQCTLTFALRYDALNGTKPKVVLMPENAAAATMSGGIYVDPTFAGFDIVAPSGLPAGTYKWIYHVIG